MRGDERPVKRTWSEKAFRSIARLSAPWAFRSARASMRVFHAFAEAERASMIDLVEAAQCTTSAERAAAYLVHAEDESRHAQIFWSESRRIAEQHQLAPLGPLRADTESLFRTLGEPAFVAFVALGESRGALQFEAYRDYFAARGEARMAALFSRILEDEARHESQARAFTEALSPHPTQLRLAMRVRRLQGAYARQASTLTQGLFGFLAALLVILFSPLALFLRGRKSP